MNEQEQFKKTLTQQLETHGYEVFIESTWRDGNKLVAAAYIRRVKA